MTQQAEIFRILSLQHREVDAMLSQLAATDDVELRAKLLPVLEQQLLAHAKAEEETLYVKLKREGEKSEAKHAEREHRDIEEALTELLALEPDDDEFPVALQNLTKTVKHHVEEEESDLYDAASRAFDTEQLDEIAAEFVENRRMQLEKLGGTDDDYAELSKDELLQQARDRDIPGRSSMSRDELISNLRAMD